MEFFSFRRQRLQTKLFFLCPNLLFNYRSYCFLFRKLKFWYNFLSVIFDYCSSVINDLIYPHFFYFFLRVIVKLFLLGDRFVRVFRFLFWKYVWVWVCLYDCVCVYMIRDILASYSLYNFQTKSDSHVCFCPQIWYPLSVPRYASGHTFSHSTSLALTHSFPKFSHFLSFVLVNRLKIFLFYSL